MIISGAYSETGSPVFSRGRDVNNDTAESETLDAAGERAFSIFFPEYKSSNFGLKVYNELRRLK